MPEYEEVRAYRITVEPIDRDADDSRDASDQSDGADAGADAPGAAVGPDRFVGPSDDATPVFVRDSGRDGPTAYVVGGLHGDETSAEIAATELARSVPERGRLVVMPRATRRAFHHGSRTHPDRGDMNRRFPQHDEPGDALAAAIWRDIAHESPDVLVDLHTSSGIYGGDPGGVGQAIFPSPAGRGDAEAVRKWFNARFISSQEVEPGNWSRTYKLDMGNTLRDGGQPTLARKAGIDLGIPAYNTEITRYRAPVGVRVRWQTQLCRALLRRSDVHVY